MPRTAESSWGLDDDPPAFVSRDRLMANLSLNDRVVVVRAEAGAGKTTLVQLWHLQGRLPGEVIWIRVNEGVASTGGFWHLFAKELIRLGLASADGPVAAYLSHGQAAGSAHLLVADELSSRSETISLVVDDVHLLHPGVQSEITSLVSRLIRMHLVCISRTKSQIALDLRRRSIFVPEVVSSQLALTKSEVADLASMLGIELAESEVKELHRATRGHVLTCRLVLSAISMSPHAAKAHRHAGDKILDMIRRVSAEASAQFLELLSPEQLRQAVQLAIPAAVDQTMANLIVDDTEAWRLLQSFEQQGLGQLRLHEGRSVFTFHALVREALSRRTAGLIGLSEYQDLCAKIVAHRAHWQDPVEIVALMLAAQQDHLVWAYFIEEFSEFTTHRTDEMVRLLIDLDSRRLRRTSSLGLALAVVLSEREARPSGRVVELAAGALADMDAAPHAGRGIEGYLRQLARLAAHRVTRNYADGADAAGEAIAMLRAMSTEQRMLLGGAEGASIVQIALTELLDGRFELVENRTAELATDSHPGRRRHARSLDAYAAAVVGDMHRTGRLLELLEDEGMGDYPEAIYAVGWNLARSILAVERGQVTAAREALTPLRARSELFEHWPILLWVRGLIRLTAGESSQGFEELSIALTRHSGRVASRSLRGMVQGIHADLALAAGKMTAAGRILDDAVVAVPVLLARARMEMRSGNPSGAQLLLGSKHLRLRTPRERSEGLLLRAALNVRIGLRDEAKSSLQHAYGVMEEFHLTSPLALVPREDLTEVHSLAGRELPQRAGAAFAGGVLSLTSRESAVLAALGEGESVRDLSARLHVSPNTLKSQMRSIFKKLGVNSRAQAVSAARERGILDESW